VIVGGLAYVFFGIGVEALIEHILTLPSWLIVLLVFLLPALEASALVGVVFPGEIAVLLGGVAAGRGSVNFAAVLIAACAGAVAGDQVGYWVGHRYGQQLLRRLPDRLLDADRLENARTFVRRTGAKGVVLGRWTAALRALVPGLAGMSHMPYPRFASANVAGGVLWAGLVASVGYVAGDSWHRVQSDLGSASTALLGLILVMGVAWHVGRRLRERRRSPGAGSPADTTAAADSDDAAVTLSATNPDTAAAWAATTPTSNSRGDPVGEAAPHQGPPARPDTSPTAEPA
jgi:membrane-associated protein